ncbi:MAG: GNAT family N-acetyltransferase [Oscillospiraceae bacterium]|nr:GNAT family N-acetyltransferase [Oscillospiraceae bacterium]
MNVNIRKGTMEDADEISALYDTVNDYFEGHTNYPGWLKGIYPIREDALNGIKNGGLYVAEADGKIAGTLILSHEPEKAYHGVEWKKELTYEKVFVIYTFAVLPEYFGKGIGTKLLEAAEKAAGENGIEALRLDVLEGNTPAIKLYEKCGFEYIDTVDLGYGKYGLDAFKLYEKLI